MDDRGNKLSLWKVSGKYSDIIWKYVMKMLLNFLNLKIKKYEDKSLLNSDWLRNHKKKLDVLLL